MTQACGEESEARKELRTEVLATAPARRVYTALYQVTLSRLNSEIPSSVSGEDEGIRSQTSGCFCSGSSRGKQSGMGACRIQGLQEGRAPVVWKVGRGALGLRELFGSSGDVLA